MSQNEKVLVKKINFSSLILIGKLFGIDVCVDKPCNNYIIVSFTKTLFDGTTKYYNYRFDCSLLEKYDTYHLQEFFKYVFFEEILYAFIQDEKGRFRAIGNYDD